LVASPEPQSQSALPHNGKLLAASEPSRQLRTSVIKPPIHQRRVCTGLPSLSARIRAEIKRTRARATGTAALIFPHDSVFIRRFVPVPRSCVSRTAPHDSAPTPTGTRTDTEIASASCGDALGLPEHPTCCLPKSHLSVCTLQLLANL
jgi:hypothetical protein